MVIINIIIVNLVTMLIISQPLYYYY